MKLNLSNIAVLFKYQGQFSTISRMIFQISRISRTFVQIAENNAAAESQVPGGTVNPTKQVHSMELACHEFITSGFLLGHTPYDI